MRIVVEGSVWEEGRDFAVVVNVVNVLSEGVRRMRRGVRGTEQAGEGEELVLLGRCQYARVMAIGAAGRRKRSSR